MNGKRFCLKCGAELDAAATFCTRCGERVVAPVTSEPTPTQQYSAPTPQYSAPTPQYSAPTQQYSTPIQQYNMNVKPKANIASKIDVTRTVLCNIIPAACFVIGLILLIVGLSVDIPSDYISSYSMTEYVGGDAYNFIIEAGLRGGQIAGAQMTKAIYTAVGLLIACVSALKIHVVKPEKESN